MGLNVGNCPRCGKIFARGLREVCPACHKEVEDQYERCLKYLQENKGATITELSDETEVSIRQITKFIREGRISIMNAPNLMYPCDVCGSLIREGMMCDSCRARLSKDLKNAKEDEHRRQQLQPEQSRNTFDIRNRL